MCKNVFVFASQKNSWQAFACEGTSDIAQVNIPIAVYYKKFVGHLSLIRLSKRGMKMESSMSKVDKEGQISSPFLFGILESSKLNEYLVFDILNTNAYTKLW